jgi:3-hydroxybutyryl-CoA dehydrogenase
VGGGDGRTLAIVGDLPVLDELSDAARQAGWDVVRGADPEAWLSVVASADRGPGGVPGPRARVLHTGSLHALDPEAAGLHLLAPFADAALVETTATPRTDPLSADRLAAFVASIGRVAEPVGDAPGLVLGRVVAQLVNEAAFLIGEGNGTAEDVDAAMTLGVNHPRGPVAWAAATGLEQLVAILDALHDERGEPAYRVAPLLRRAVAVGGGLGDERPVPAPGAPTQVGVPST